MYFEANAQTSSRMVHAEDSREVYRWVVYLVRTSHIRDLSDPKKPSEVRKKKSGCAGSVLTEK